MINSVRKVQDPAVRLTRTTACCQMKLSDEGKRIIYGINVMPFVSVIKHIRKTAFYIKIELLLSFINFGPH